VLESAAVAALAAAAAAAVSTAAAGGAASVVLPAAAAALSPASVMTRGCGKAAGSSARSWLQAPRRLRHAAP
jgi:hypothetical protein